MHTIQNPLPDLPRITHILQEKRILSHSRRPKSLRIAPHRNDQLIIIQLEPLPLLRPRRQRLLRGLSRRRGLRHHRVDLNSNALVGEADVVRPSLVILCVCDTGADGLDGGAELEGADGGGGEEGGECKVGAGGDDDGLVFLIV